MSNFIVRKVAVLGAGVMGAQIAAHCVNARVPVVLFDLPAKEGPNFLELLLVETDVASVTLEEHQASQPSDPVTGGVTDNSARRGDCDHPPDREMAKRGEGAGGYENRFTRQRNAEALYGNEEEYDCIAVGFNEPNDRAMHSGNLLNEVSQGNLAAQRAVS